MSCIWEDSATDSGRVVQQHELRGFRCEKEISSSDHRLSHRFVL